MKRIRIAAAHLGHLLGDFEQDDTGGWIAECLYCDRLAALSGREAAGRALTVPCDRVPVQIARTA